MDSIKVCGLSKHFRVHVKKPGVLGSVTSLFKRVYSISKAVHNISFSIEAGELVGFIGPNGAGKTTTLKCLSGLLYPSQGSISVLGYNPFDRNHSFLKQIALVMGQKDQLWWDLPPIESFFLLKEIYEVSDADFKKTLSDLSDIMDLHNILHIQVRKLSLGQRMKCEIAAQLLHKPKILFLDEPTIGLDIVMQEKIRKFISIYNQHYKATIILTSHYMKDVKELCKRIIVINKGEILYDGKLDSIVSKFSQLKRITLVLDKPISSSNFSKYGKIIEDTYPKIVLELDRNKIILTTDFLLSHFPINDLTIEEPEIEEIIRTIFKKSQV